MKIRHDMAEKKLVPGGGGIRICMLVHTLAAQAKAKAKTKAGLGLHNSSFETWVIHPKLQID